MKTRILFCLALAAGTTLAQTQSASSRPNAPQAAPSAQAPPAVKPAVPPPSEAGKVKAAIPEQKPDEAGSALAPTDAVITIKGLCTGTARPVVGRTAGQKPAAAASSKACTTVITKEQFDALIDAVGQPGQIIPPSARQRVAQSYVDLLAVSGAAKKAGMEDSPKFQESMRLMRLQKLAEMYSRDLQEKYRNPSPEEIEAYYQQNLPKYEEVKLHRIFIPKNNPSAQNKEEFEKKAQSAANELRERAAKGEDPEELQKAAYTTLELTTPPMKTDLGGRRRGMLPAQLEAEVFSLKPGEVGKVDEESSGYMIYKVDSKQTAPLDQTLKSEISRDLFRQKMESAMKGITGAVHADFNEKYFGPANAPVAAVPGAPAVPAGAKPPAPAPAPGTGQPN